MVRMSPNTFLWVKLGDKGGHDNGLVATEMLTS